MVGFGSSAGSHGFGEDFQVVGAGPVMFLFVLLVGVLFDKEFTGLLQDSSALCDRVFFVTPVEKIGPLGAGLFTSNPEDSGDPNN